MKKAHTLGAKTREERVHDHRRDYYSTVLLLSMIRLVPCPNSIRKPACIQAKSSLSASCLRFPGRPLPCLLSLAEPRLRCPVCRAARAHAPATALASPSGLVPKVVGTARAPSLSSIVTPSNCSFPSVPDAAPLKSARKAKTKAAGALESSCVGSSTTRGKWSIGIGRRSMSTINGFIP